MKYKRRVIELHLDLYRFIRIRRSIDRSSRVLKVAKLTFTDSPLANNVESNVRSMRLKLPRVATYPIQTTILHSFDRVIFVRKGCNTALPSM